MKETLVYCCIPVFEMSLEEMQAIEYSETPALHIKDAALQINEMVQVASNLYEYLRNTMADSMKMMELEQLCHRAGVPYVWYVSGQRVH